MRASVAATRASINSVPGPGELGCYALSSYETCAGAAAQICVSDVQQTLLLALVQNPAPGSLANQGARVQAGLAQADTALLAISDGLLFANSKKVSDGQGTHAASILGAHATVAAAAGS